MPISGLRGTGNARRITSGGNRNPASAELGCSMGRWRKATLHFATLVDRGRTRSMQQCSVRRMSMGWRTYARADDPHTNCRHAISTMGASAHFKMASAAL